ncbi:hypothetical protein P171DRAFT_512095 [Karstenula rhodostoma CBS 690.94]|uniref:Uncharacterized protein n=1 Tax=Karstenula rhodostoma CBS 690.94 TaxID=1392251 RepID=A0A9P4UC32_9PLEO|nr:hypothetical protein P171DRAFT_512095 [Karstenula rhodostoma CBS 690.94]
MSQSTSAVACCCYGDRALFGSLLGLYATAWVTTKLQKILKDTYVKASQASARAGKKLKNWDKDSDRLVKSAGQFVTKIKPRDIKPCSQEGLHGALASQHYLAKSTRIQVRVGWTSMFRMFDYQFEPVFQALSVMNPDVRFHDVDVVVGRSTLLLLLQVAEGKSKKTFALDLKMVGQTLFIHAKGSGRAAAASESYGRNFKDQFTQPTGEDDADGYHRVLRYKLGPLALVVRLEADAFLAEAEAPLSESDDTTFYGSKTVDSSSQHSGIPHPHATSLILSGHYISQSLVTELKTTNTGIESMVSKAMPQLWAGQKDTVIVGDRKSGETDPNATLSKKQRKQAAGKLALAKKEGEAGGFAMFYSADVRDIRQDRFDWEDDKQPDLQKLVGLLKGLTEAVGQVKGGKMLLRKTERTGPLELYEGGDDMTDALPKEIIETFWK